MNSFTIGYKKANLKSLILLCTFIVHPSIHFPYLLILWRVTGSGAYPRSYRYNAWNNPGLGANPFIDNDDDDDDEDELPILLHPRHGGPAHFSLFCLPYEFPALIMQQND